MRISFCAFPSVSREKDEEGRVPPRRRRRRTSYKLLPFVKSGHGRERETKPGRLTFPLAVTAAAAEEVGWPKKRERERGRNIGKDEEGFGGLPSPLFLPTRDDRVDF